MYTVAPNNGWLFNVFRLNESVNDLDSRVSAASNNVVVINSLSDFAIQDATTITLSANTAYTFGDLITTSKRFIVEANVSVTSTAGFVTSLVYTGTETMFTSVGDNFMVFNITYSCPNGTVFNYNRSGIFILERTSCTSCVNVGSVTGSGFTSLNWFNNNFASVTGQGLQFFGSLFVMSFIKIFMNSNSPFFIGLDLGTTIFYNFEAADIELLGVNGSVGIEGLVNSGNIEVGSVATVTNSNFSGGGMIPLLNIVDGDIRWTFRGNADVPDSLDDALIYFSENATNTVISAASTDGSNAVKVAGTWSFEGLHGYAATADGRVTYLGERLTHAPLDISLHLISVGGGAIRAKVYLAKNGVVVNPAATAVDISGSLSKNVMLLWQVQFNLNDYIEVFVENQTNANDILVKDAILRIR